MRAKWISGKRTAALFSYLSSFFFISPRCRSHSVDSCRRRMQGDRMAADPLRVCWSRSMQ